MNGIICKFYENETCIRTSDIMSVSDALSIIEEYDGNKTISIIGYTTKTGEALVRSCRGYDSLYEQEGVPVLRK